MPEDYLLKIKNLLPSILPTVNLFVYTDYEVVTVFLGEANQKIEMLFVRPDRMRRSIGKTLMNFALHELHAKKVDVNEQNPAAVAFYEKMGFVVVGRSPVDGLGKPFPLLHLEFPR